jgi:hypothetical protein
MIVPWSGPEVRRLIKEGYLEEKTVAVSYPNFSGQYRGVFRKQYRFGSQPAVVIIDIQTISNTRPPHVEGQFKTCEEREPCEVASVSGSVRRSGMSTLTLTFPAGRDSKKFEVALERGQTDAMVAHYEAAMFAGQTHLRANHVGPNPSDIQQDVYVYQWTNNLPRDTFNGERLILGHLVVDSCEHLLLASETAATASCKTHIKLTGGAEAIFASRSTEQSMKASFGKQPDGTWVGTGVEYTAPPYSLSQ